MAAGDAVKLVDAVRDDVREFVGATERSDDLTILALRWNGGGLMRENGDDQTENLRRTSAHDDFDAPVHGLGSVRGSAHHGLAFAAAGDLDVFAGNASAGQIFTHPLRTLQGELVVVLRCFRPHRCDR